MKVYLVFLVLAVLSLLFGVGLLAASVGQVTNGAYHLPVGSTYCAYLGFDTVTGGSLDVTFNVSSGTVTQYVMTGEQFTAFFAGTGSAFLATASGSRGSFSGGLPSGGSYYVVICHGSGSENTVQDGISTVTVNALSAGPIYAGAGGVVVGVVFGVIALLLRNRPARRAAPMAAPMGPAGFGTIVLAVENATAADETVSIVMNGVAVGSLPVPAGRTAQATLHPALANPYGSPVRVEAVLADGRRATQELTATAYQGSSMRLRITGLPEGGAVPPSGPTGP